MEHFIDIQSPPPKIPHKEEEEEEKENEDEEGEIRSSPYHNSGLVTDIQVQYNPAIADPRVVENLTIADCGSVP